MADNYKHSDITGIIIKAFYNVYQLGYGFLEKVYENALLIKLKKLGLEYVAQYLIEVFYDNLKVGFHIADIMVNNCVLVEIKAPEILCEEHKAQLSNYLKATDIEVGLLLNFGKNRIQKKSFYYGI